MGLTALRLSIHDRVPAQESRKRLQRLTCYSFPSACKQACAVHGFRDGIDGATLVHPFEEFLLKKAGNAFSV